MNVKEIAIRQQYSYEPSPGMLTGKVIFTHDMGEVTVNISTEQAARFVALLADAILETAKVVGNTMKKEIIDQTLAIEAAK